MLSYTVRRVEEPPALDAGWNGPGWRDAEALSISHFHPESSAHHPRAQARMLYDAQGLYIQFYVEDRYVRATFTEYQSPVCEDSCVEFFVQPCPDKDYLNFEMNAIGTLLLYCIEDFAQRKFKPVPSEAATGMRVYHSLPGPMEEEHAGPLEWTVAYFVPFELLERYTEPVGDPAGKEWRANFYKCAEKSSHPHWASWSPIGEELLFHQPKYFGVIRFGE